MEGPKAAKKRRLTDKTVPSALGSNPVFAEDSKMYQDLLEMERKLDWQMSRKKVEIQDTLSRPTSMTRTLRLFLSHTVSGQSWQTGDASAEATVPNFETGEGVPAWQFKLEGRLIELPNQRAKDRPVARKLSSFIRKMHIELDRDRTLYPDGNMSEFHTTQNAPELDGFTLRRTGDTSVKLKVIIDLKQTPEMYRLAPPLGQILGIKEETRQGAIQALWNYVKINQLQDKLDRRLIRADDALRPLIGAEGISFQVLGELCHRFLLPAEPIVLHYTIDPSQAPSERPQAWDVEIRTEDAGAKAKMTTVNVAMSGEGTAELQKLDEEITYLAQSLHNSQQKLAFLRSFSSDPAEFIQTWLASQARDLDGVLGTSENAVLGPGGGLLGGGSIGGAGSASEAQALEDAAGRKVRPEELRRSEFFKLPWVEEAVAIQEGLRVAELQKQKTGV